MMTVPVKPGGLVALWVLVQAQTFGTLVHQTTRLDGAWTIKSSVVSC
jgi:hypothetical protein